MSAAFFLASLVHVPVGPSNVHLILNGLLGIVLGWAAFPAIFVALLLQALFFGYGGITVFGINTVIMGVPAVACHYLFGRSLRREGRFAWLWGAAAGGSAILMTCAGIGAALAMTGREFFPAAQLVLIAHLPVVAVEAAITGTIVVFLQRVKPEVLALHAATVGGITCALREVWHTIVPALLLVCSAANPGFRPQITSVRVCRGRRHQRLRLLRRQCSRAGRTHSCG